MEIPVRGRGQEGVDYIPDTPPSELRGNMHILVVEDVSMNQRLIKQTLSRLSYRVTIAQTGEEAIDIIKKTSKVFKLILMDVELGPGINGFETARQIRQENSLTPIVSFSSQTIDEEFSKRAKEAGMQGCVFKQINEQVIRKTLEAYIGQF